MKKILGSDEAKQHVCCMADRKCVGTACMGWIQETIPVSVPVATAPKPASKKKGSSEPKVTTAALSTTVLQTTNRGFCGMVSHKE